MLAWRGVGSVSCCPQAVAADHEAVAGEVVALDLPRPPARRLRPWGVRCAQAGVWTFSAAPKAKNPTAQLKGLVLRKNSSFLIA